MAAPALAGALPLLPTELIPLWPGPAPGGEGVKVTQRVVLRRPDSPPTDIATYGITRPTLAILRPATSNGTALLVIPGGSYTRIAMAPDGGEIARYFAERGFTVGSLLYRLPGDGWAAGPDAPLQDAQRALRLLRKAAGSRNRWIGTLGFSAGGHVAGMLATRFAQRTYPKLADEDAHPARPDFAGLFFPVITMTDPHAHRASRIKLIGGNPDRERIRRWSVESAIPADAPPCFITAAADDRTVPVENSLLMFQALRAAKVPAACHIFDQGGHGFGSIADAAGPGRHWPVLFLDWLGRQKLD